ncbi:UNVERIFIED_CONTAM: phosphate ABC transporter substrate-binding protein (PhoT family) [Acetivibrio alkalicellulosi]
MSKLIRKLSLAVIISVGLGVVFTGCGGNNDTPSTISDPTSKPAAEKTEDANQESSLSGRINIVGSTSVAPLAQKLADDFTDMETGVRISIQSLGSSAGVQAANEGNADIGMSSRELKDEEKEWGMTEHFIAVDGIALVVNPSNSVSELTVEQVTKIYTGEITNWKDVGGDDKDIIVVVREDASGTKAAFDEILDLKDKVISDALVADSGGAVRANVSSTNETIGYLSLGSVNDDVKALSINGSKPSEDTIRSGEYPISRRFLFLTKGDIKPELQAYIDYIFTSAGKEIVSKEGYVPVN